VAIYDLFISYSSKDRAWAEKLEADLRVTYPSLRVFFDRKSIAAGAKWRQDLDNAIYNSKHLLFFWSKNADSPNASGTKEVDPEIEGFRAHRRLTPELEGSARIIFYVPLEDERGGGVADFQGFPAFRPFYDPRAKDLGISNLDFAPARGEWSRMLGMVGDAISAADKATPVIAGIVATNSGELPLIDLIHGRKKKPDGPTLDEFLVEFGLTWAGVCGRYGRDALDWRPDGTNTIVTLMEQIRVRVNANLAAADHFQWKHVDLTNPIGYKENIRQIYEKASVVVLDPISLYDDICAGVLLDLQDYVNREESVVIALSPNLTAPAATIATDVQAMYFRSLSSLLEDYLQPKIPPGAVFYARCALDVQRTLQIDPLIRNRIRYPHLLTRRSAEREAAKNIARPR
jgi:hypothetical protein